MDNSQKLCPKCNKWKDKSLFSKCSKTKDKLNSLCKKCHNTFNKKWRKKNPKYFNAWYNLHKEEVSLKAKEYYKENKIVIKERVKKYQQTLEGKESKKKSFQKFMSNPENKSSLHKKMVENKRILRKDPINGPIFILHTHLMQGIYRVMVLLREDKNIKFKKSKRSLEVLGLSSWEEFKVYIESLWTTGMGWKNYGGCEGCWSIDHITPISSANDENDVYKLNHFSNLQPMWHLDNISKSNKLITN